MSETAPKNADKKARVFNLEEMMAETLRNAPKNEETDHGSYTAPNIPSSSSQASESGHSSSAAQSDDDDFMPMLPPGFKNKPDDAAATKDDEELSDDSDFDENEAISTIKLIPAACEANITHGNIAVSALRVEPAGVRFASGGLDYYVKLFDFQKMDMSMRCDKELLPAESHIINSLAFSANGETLVVASGECIIRLLDRAGKQWSETVRGDQYLVDLNITKGHTATVNCVEFNPLNKNEFLSCSDDGSLRIWNLEDHKVITKCINKHRKVIKTKGAQGKRVSPQVCAYSPDGKWIAAGCDDGSIQAWKYGSQYVNVNYLVRKAHNGSITSIAFSPDSRRILTRGFDDTLKMWSLDNNKEPLLVKTGLENGFKSTDCGFSPRAELVFTGTSSPHKDVPGSLMFFDPQTFELVYKIDYPGVSCHRIQWHPRLNQIVVGLSDGSVRVYYDQNISQRGVMSCVTKPIKRNRASEVVREDMILSPLSLEMFQPRGEEGEEKEVTAWRLKKYLRMQDNKLRPEFRKPADMPINGKSANGRVAASGGSLHSYLAKQIGTARNAEFLRDQDVRASILKHAKEAEENPLYIDKAYRKNQPKKIFQEVTAEEQEEEELQPTMSYTTLVEAQRNYFRTGATKPVKFRKQQLLRLKKMIEENREQLCDAVWKDLRRRHEATESVEIGMLLQEIDYFLKNIDTWSSATKVEKTFTTALDKPVIEKDPKGVVLIISPWNYPVSMALLPLIAILAAGNTSIIKPSEVSEHTAECLNEIVPKYFESNYLTVVTGGIPESTELLKERYDHIMYTGCPPVAKIIMAAAAKHLTPVTLELGGKCPVVVEADADIDISAKRVAWGKWMNCGQTCLAPDYVLVNSSVKDKFVESMKKYIREFYGDDIQASKDYARIINERHFDRISKLLDESNGKALLDGKRDRADRFIPPTILDVQLDDAFMKDEIFGPVLPIITVSNISEAISIINDGEKPLAAYIFTRNEAKVNRLLNETSSGGVTVNDVIMHMTVDTLPFGGIGTSGMGRYRGKFGFDTFTHEKAVLHRGFFGETLLAARYPPLTQEKLNNLRRLTGTRISLNFANCITLPAILVSFVFGMIAQKYTRALP
ncbi:unnamed protein product [Caenorhabditis bovis]|uniref:Aldehyde dehydrogenase domain-containing protein n=1 Tax=Caenorhabditis bovis TaxID=2654633 RepID=A0A8S1E9E6_9PELO|nr:unnamed protein product [Caenorhabditis bovis]